MKKSLLGFVLLVVLNSGTQAQETPSPSQQLCLLNSNPDVWNILLLTSDQLHRVKLIQDACKEECEAAGAQYTGNGISTADGSTVLSELRNILTREQFEAWEGYCATGEVKVAPSTK